jgi:hypothetical protein
LAQDFHSAVTKLDLATDIVSWRFEMIRSFWSRETNPHFFLEITQECNIACKLCFQCARPGKKSLEQIGSELDLISGKRALYAVTVAGGEPTLHPDLMEIVGLIKSRGFMVNLATNGLICTDIMLSDLRAAGLSNVFFHIDGSQVRPDLPRNADHRDVLNLIKEKTALAADQGLDAGVCCILDDDSSQRFESDLEYLISLPHITIVFFAHALDTKWLDSSHERDAGDGSYDVRSHPLNKRRLDNLAVMQKIKTRYQINPFIYHPSSKVDGKTVNQFQSIYYLLPVLHDGDKVRVLPVESNGLDTLLIKLRKFLHGRYVFLMPRKKTLPFVYLLLKQLQFMQFKNMVAMVKSLFSRKTSLVFKNMSIEQSWSVADNGVPVCAETCLNPTIRDNTIVPVCIADCYQDLEMSKDITESCAAQ